MITHLVYRDMALKSQLQQQFWQLGAHGSLEDLSGVAAEFVAIGFRRRKIEDEPALELAGLLVWAADGLLDGIIRGSKLSQAQARAALFAAWRGIATAAAPTEARP